MRAGKKMATLRHPKGETKPHAETHAVLAHPPKHKTMNCALKMAVKKSS
jgi:hypothetical protein